MKLRQFIVALEKRSEIVDNPDTVEVTMADGIPVVNPVLKDNTIYITDIEENTVDDESEG